MSGGWSSDPSGARSDERLVVAVEATHLLRDVRGIGRYVRAVLPRVMALEPRLRLALFTRHDVERLVAMVRSDPGLCGRVCALKARELKRSSPDLTWYPGNVASPLPPRGAIVVTMHDVAPLVLPDPRPSRWWKNLRWRRRYAVTARRATVIMADSAFTAHEVGRVLGFPSRRIRVTPLAADDFPVPPAAADAAALARLSVTLPFFLAVGAADRRKNLALLYGAMRRVVGSNLPATLVLAGPRRGGDPPPPSAPWVRMLGFVSDSDLAVLYRRATALVMPSIYEGFGLPVLEAMRLGGPVICARASSLPEVAGEAAAWVDPNDEVDLAATITRVLSDDGMRARMRAAGLRRAARFSWDETARATIKAFEDALGLCGTNLSGWPRREDLDAEPSRRLQGRGAR